MSGNTGISEIIEQLELFSEVASRVHNSGFVKYVKSQKKIGFHFSVHHNRPPEFMKNWPEEDLVNGFLTPFRMLIQRNEPSSWRQIGKLVDTLNVPAKYKDSFRRARINLNDYLNSPAGSKINMSFEFSGAPENHRDILNTFINGYYSHYSERKRLENWRIHPTTYYCLEFLFINILITISDLSYRMSEEINKPMIEFLRRQEV